MPIDFYLLLYFDTLPSFAFLAETGCTFGSLHSRAVPQAPLSYFVTDACLAAQCLKLCFQPLASHVLGIFAFGRACSSCSSWGGLPSYRLQFSWVLAREGCPSPSHSFLIRLPSPCSLVDASLLLCFGTARPSAPKCQFFHSLCLRAFHSRDAWVTFSCAVTYVSCLHLACSLLWWIRGVRVVYALTRCWKGNFCLWFFLLWFVLSKCSPHYVNSIGSISRPWHLCFSMSLL